MSATLICTDGAAERTESDGAEKAYGWTKSDIMAAVSVTAAEHATQRA